VTEISENARVQVLLADFANQDPANKINLLGANWNIAAVQPTGMAPPQAVVILVEIPSQFDGADFTISVALLDEAGSAVDVPRPTGQVEPLRVRQAFRAERPKIAGVDAPADLPCRVQMILNFIMGIPLAAGRRYRWHVEIDDTASPQWEADFYIAESPPEQ
jgi:hypothetical protein